ncbi:RHS repeat-associated core domain-containing protein [Ferruginibacter sp.]|nr:hypothetical protein [Ferruginibacter sp.]
MGITNRKFSSNKYRYGFNGKENDKDLSAGGQDFGERIYDGRLGKFLSVDPYYKNFPFYSPYLFAGNSPIKYIDENGGYKIEGSIKSKYPRIYKYLSKNLEKEMLSSSLVAHGFKKLNPKLTDDNLKEMFTYGSGPTIWADKAPGMFLDATAKYEFDDRSLNINEKIFTYVEGVLKSKKSTNEEKTRALMFLKIVITHETGHDAEKMKGGLNADGTPKMATTLDEQRKLHDELNIGEAGYELTEYIYGLPAFKNIANKDKKELVPKIKGGNDGNKVEVLDNVIKKANSSEEGKQTLPTIPSDDKKTPVIK